MIEASTLHLKNKSMSQYFLVHPDNPQARLIKKTVEHIRKGAVVVYPTDSCYALGCHLGDKHALERLRRIRQVDASHHFTIVCRDLSELSHYAVVDNSAFRSLRSYTPGPYTFILKASRDVPRRLQVSKRKTIGLRIPDHPVALALLHELGEPLISTTLILPNESVAMTDPEDIRSRLGSQVDVIVAAGSCGFDATTVIDMAEGNYQILRQGKGEFKI